MSTHATGEFEIKSWDEETYEESEHEARLSRATVTQSFSGSIEGEGQVQYLMMYADESNARYVGQQRIVGGLDGRAGSFVLHLNGTFDGKKAEATWSVVPDSATGELRGLRGEGSFSAPLGSRASYSLDYELE